MPSLKWIGKKAIKNHHNEVKYHVIECKETIGDPDSGNMVVRGDNLLALKSLLPYYAGKVKMIYIDPPYNTGNTSWVYNDAVDSPIIKKWLDKVVDSNDLSRSDKWLCMIYPRLKLLHKFLKEDGVIYISIDDAEVDNLKLVLNEIFGSNNHLATLIWRGMHTVRNSSKDFNKNTEYILAFAKNKNKLIVPGQKDTYLRYMVDKSKNYPLDDNDGNGKYKLDPIYARNYAEPYKYTFKNGVVWEAPRGNYPRYSQKTLAEMDDRGEIVFTGKEPKAKRYLKNVQEGIPPSTLLDSDLVGFNKDGTEELYKIFGDKVFDQPKPTKLIKYLMKIQRKIDDKDFIVLDSFAGSGTTGHAVLDLNKEDGGNRKFILIEMEDYAKEVTAERVKKVIEGYRYTGKEKIYLMKPLKLSTTKILNMKFMTELAEEVNQLIESSKEEYDKIEKKFKDNTLEVIGIKEVEEFMPGIGGGFQYCELSEELFDEFGLLNENITFKMLAKHIYFTEFGTALKESEIQEENFFAGGFKDKALYVFLDKKFTRRDLSKLSKDFKEFIVYADSTTLSNEQLKEQNIILKKLPFEIKDK